MKRYISLAGAMVLGTVVANQDSKKNVSAVATKTQALELIKAEPAVTLQGTRAAIRSEFSPFRVEVKSRKSYLSPNVERNTSRFTDNTFNAPYDERHTSKYTENTFNTPGVEALSEPSYTSRRSYRVQYDINNGKEESYNNFGVHRRFDYSPEVRRFDYSPEGSFEVENRRSSSPRGVHAGYYEFSAERSFTPKGVQAGDYEFSRES